MEKLGEKNRAKLIDLLSERLTFERAAIRLYDKVLARIAAEAGGDADRRVQRLAPTLREFREQEQEHADWLAQQIRLLGGDALVVSEQGRLAEEEARGVETVILTPDRPIVQLCHALLAAELVDHAGWDLLVQLADEAGDRDAKKAFKKRLAEEDDHRDFLRRVQEQFAMSAVLGEQPPAP